MYVYSARQSLLVAVANHFGLYLQLGLNFVTFFGKLSDMIEELFDFIDPLQKYDYASDESGLVRKVRRDTIILKRRTDSRLDFE